MNRLAVLALSAPLLLIGAAYPKVQKDEAVMVDEPGYAAEAPVTYRPCRPGPGDDHCIQLYERGVRASYARWLRDHDPDAPRTQVAMGGPEEPVAHRRHHGHHDSTRCVDEDGGDEARGM
jgi:hypothetical protein